MHQLVAQHIQTIEHDGQHHAGLIGHHRLHGACIGGTELRFPTVGSIVIAQGFPEAIENVLVLDQDPDRSAELAEYRLFQAAISIRLDQHIDEALQIFALHPLEAELFGIGGIQSNPQKDETGIRIVRFLLGTRQPTDGTVQADGRRFGVCGVGFQSGFQIGGGHYRISDGSGNTIAVLIQGFRLCRSDIFVVGFPR